ncbi:MAG: helix-turn-helix domain-containing protein [Ruminococcus flavefaciens]|nr:helix-turn-helix domain-containing protein [Ruminococcus flavefaciens]
MYPTIDMKATGLRIRKIMNQRNLTVKDVQSYLNLSSVQSIYHWMNGQSVPTVDNLYALSELFQLPIDAIIVGNRKYHTLELDDSFYNRLYVYYAAMGKLSVLSGKMMEEGLQGRIYG